MPPRKKKRLPFFVWLLFFVLPIMGAVLSSFYWSRKIVQPPPPAPRISPPSTYQVEAETLKTLIEATCLEIGLKRQYIELEEEEAKILLPQRAEERFFSTLKRKVGSLKGVQYEVLEGEKSLILRSGTNSFKVTLLPFKEVMISLIVDDLGEDINLASRFLELGEPLTLSILPLRKYSREIALKASRRGFEVLLHIPMEPKAYPLQDPGKGALLLSMDKEEIRQRVRSFIKALPYVQGANNHMGSRFMEDPEMARVVLETLGEEGLFFLDSLTTPNSAAESEAQKLGLPLYKRDVFMDNGKTVENFLKGWDELVKIAKRKGQAIGICHPYPSTLMGLKRVINNFENIPLFPLSWLLPSNLVF
jgi:polysaccharide deacetylase 2 family uncharacterized protein YibQ